MKDGGALRPEDLEISGPLDRRLEVAISLPMDAVLVAMTARMAGGGGGRMARSKAARRLIAAGAAATPGLLEEAGKIARRLQRERDTVAETSPE